MAVLCDAENLHKGGGDKFLTDKWSSFKKFFLNGPYKRIEFRNLVTI